MDDVRTAIAGTNALGPVGNIDGGWIGAHWRESVEGRGAGAALRLSGATALEAGTARR